MDPLSSSSSSSPDTEISTLTNLATLGHFRQILDRISTLRSLPHSLLPHHHLAYLTFSVLSLFKLKRYSQALDELNNSLDCNFDELKYESYPDQYGPKTGSMVPFALRWLHAIVPDKVGERSVALDRLYMLLDFVRNKKIGSDKNGDLWGRREKLVLGSIVSIHLAQKEFTVALGLMEGMVGKGDVKDLDPMLVSKLGYVQMQIGDLEGAKGTFARVEGMVADKLEEVWVKNLLGRNKALGYLVGKDYLSAVREYEECVERDGTDVVALNNKAICLMYLRELSGSITVLEGALERVPTVALNEPLVVNLCSMYELAYVNHLDIKRTLSNWIARTAPDDFDASCTRI